MKIIAIATTLLAAFAAGELSIQEVSDRLREKANNIKAQLEGVDEESSASMLMDIAFYKSASNAVLDTNRAPAEIRAMVTDDAMSEDGFRKLNCAGGRCKVPVSLSGIWHYGCWCNFGRDLLSGSGSPMNRHDEACQRMQYCLRCAKLDAEDDGTYTCDPQNDKWNAGFRWGKKSLVADCKKKNPEDTCGTHLCMCEMTLLADIIALIWEGYVYDPQFKHPSIGGDFIAEDNCPTTAGPNPSAIECCGRYPSRYPYSLGGNKACCEYDESIYNELTQHCCANSGVEDLGSSCF